MKDKFSIYYIPKEKNEKKFSFIYCISDNQFISALRYYLIELKYNSIYELKNSKLERIIDTMSFLKSLNSTPIKIDEYTKLYDSAKMLFEYTVILETTKNNKLKYDEANKYDLMQWKRIMKYFDESVKNDYKMYRNNKIFVSEVNKNDLNYIEKNYGIIKEKKHKKK